MMKHIWHCIIYKKKHFMFLVFGVLVISVALAQEPAIIPRPAESIVLKEGVSFSINEGIAIASAPAFLSEAQILADYLKKVFGITALVKQTGGLSSSKTGVLLKYVPADEVAEEGYILDVSGQQVQILASGSSGAYYGCMSLLQSIMRGSAGDIVIPGIHVKDQPRFRWRGLMLDCSRTFLPVAYLKKTIDRMSFYKMNRLHLHLTDDQGWRLEIKKYPLLTGKGAYFDKRYNEPKEFQGFYTQVQMKELVEYARKRHITIIPEIEFPGHNHAALYAYPAFSCSGEVSPIFPYFSGPGITKSVFCAGNKNTYRFFKNVIDEVAHVFPAQYIHLGGDEVPEGTWDDCRNCRQMMDSPGIKDQEHLQGYMMNRVGSDVTANARRPIGWDEIFPQGVDKKWIIMVWRGQNRGLDEIKAGYDVILCPTSNLYFDYSYATTPTKKVYAFDPVPENLTEEETDRYLGIQACFWSHIDRTESRIDYQLFPRVLALAERAWSDKSVTDYADFHQRELKLRYWLDYFDVKANRGEQ